MKSFLRSTGAATAAFLILAVTSMGISGGPDYKTSAVVTTGNYAGIMTAQSHVPLASTDPTTFPQPTGLNSIGIFSVTVPKKGSATGPVVIFEEGQTYNGTINATADPKTAKLSGEVQGTFSYQGSYVSSTEHTTVVESSKTTTTDKTGYSAQTYAASAAGNIESHIKTDTTLFTTGSVRLVGRADIQFALTVNDPFDEIIYKVSGFKQAD